MAEENIVISPFIEENLGNCSYDVTLGRYYYREGHPKEGHTIYNPYNEEDVGRVWGKEYSVAQPSRGPLTQGISPDDLVIWLAPGETVLGHTEEFIGGKDKINTMMKARSSIGRNFLTVCRCAGWGDIGYINRWTMEITNNSRYYHIPLVVGRRLAQLAFFEVEPIEQKDAYSNKGKYQTTLNLEELRRNWHPSQMLPRMWRDREINRDNK